MSEKLLYKMTANSIILNGEGRGGQANITAYDVATALSYGSLSKYAYYIGRAKYCHDKKAEELLYGHLERKIQKAINKNKWQDAKGRASGMALLVLYEGVYGIACNHCHGRGVVCKKSRGISYLNQQKQCGKCNGIGLGRLSERKRAEIANVSRSSWSRTWESRNERFVQYVTGLERDVLVHLRKQFYS